MKNILKSVIIWWILCWSLLWSQSFAAWICPSNWQLLKRSDYLLKLVEIENSNSTFIKKMLQEYKTNANELRKKKTQLLNSYTVLKDWITQWKYWDPSKFTSNVVFTAKQTQLETDFTTFDTDFNTYKVQYLDIDYLTKLRNWDNDTYIETVNVHVQPDSWWTTTSNNVWCINNTLFQEIEKEYKKLELQFTITQMLFNDLKSIVDKWIETTWWTSNYQNMINDILWSTFAPWWIIWWTNLHNKEFLKVEKDWNTYIVATVNLLCDKQWKDYLWKLVTWTSDPLECYIWIPSTKSIPHQNFDLIKNSSWTSYWFLKYKINAFKSITATSWSNTFTIDKWTWYLIIYYNFEENTFKLSYYDEKWRELNTFSMNSTDDLVFNDYLWITSFNWKLLVSNTTNDVKQTIRSFYSNTTIADNWKVVPILWDSDNINWVIDNKVVDLNLKQIKNKILNTWKVNITETSNDSKKYTINVSPQLLRYFKDNVFWTVEDINKILNISWQTTQIWNIDNNDWFIDLLTKDFSWQTILWWTWNLNTWSLYTNTTWTRINFLRNLQNWWVTINWSLKEYWFLDPKFKWDNNWKEYARWMIVSIWKMMSNKTNWWDFYLFPLIDQDWWTMLNITNLTKTFNETSKIWVCWKTQYTCWWITIQQWKEYKQQDITNFVASARKDYWKTWCNVATKEEFQCLTKKIESPTTLIIWDNRKWLQDSLMYKFTVDITQSRIEDAIQYKFITSIQQKVWNSVIKIRRWKKDVHWNKIEYYIKSIQNEQELNTIKTKFPWKYLVNLIVTTNFNDFDKDNTDLSKRDLLINNPTWLLTTQQIIDLFWPQT